jgi:Protein of unknown function (DUF3618)
MGQEPRDIERQIEGTREQMGETVQALADKANVPGRVKGYVSDKKDAVTSKVSGAKDTVAGGAGTAAQAGSSVAGTAKSKAAQGAGVAKDNPLGLALGAIAAGFLIGSALPSTRVEDEHVGPLADQVKDQAREVGSEAIEHGKQVAQEVAHQTADVTKESAREHGEELRDAVSQHTS